MRVKKWLVLDLKKIARVKRLLEVSSDWEVIETALDILLSKTKIAELRKQSIKKGQ